MMNRIILIGNGFDLAHGLETSYKSYIEYYWDTRLVEVARCNHYIESDGMTTFSIKNIQKIWSGILSELYFRYDMEENSVRKMVELIKQDTENFQITKSPFFQAVDTSIEIKNWVDIEHEYYWILKQIVKEDRKPYPTPRKLDEEFEVLKTKLQKYLSNIQKEQIKPDLIKSCIRHAIFEPFDIRDISNNDWCNFEQALIARVDQFENAFRGIAHNYLRQPHLAHFEYQDAVFYLQGLDSESTSTNSNNESLPANVNKEQHIRNVKNNNPSVPKSFLWPDQILLLNFNYTNMADLYLPKDSEFKVNHIHGELDNEKNPIIFGYGDELDEDYKRISNLNDNNYLSNIKSIRYLETDNYRKLLSFIDSAPFQIYIMGHSCGNSDRTLLNTLFEHKNCVSIKPFYHQKDDGTDNYIEIVQNISRNFNDMRLMRDRVVNKTYCRPLVPQGTK